MTNPGPHRGGPGIDRAPKRANMEITTRISGPLHQDWRSRLASRAIAARSQGVDPGGLVVLPFELPHCLSVAAKSRVPPEPNRRPRILLFTQFFTSGRCSQCARAVRRSKTGNLRNCAAATRNGERHLLMPAAFGDDVRSDQWTRGLDGLAFPT
jgi:hypothetical protein